MKAEPDLSFLMARPLMVKHWQSLELVLVGCGGTGSWLVPHLARLVRELARTGKKATLTLVDPDRVEAANITRQNFSDCESGLPKATTLAFRYGTAWGLEIPAYHRRFGPELARGGNWNTLTVLVGAVDNAAARQSLAGMLERNTAEASNLFWLDCGNAGAGSDSGQVLLGNCLSVRALSGAFIRPGICTGLPAPSLQHPELLEPTPEELADHNLSCAELAALNRQGLVVNQRVAAEAADYLYRLTLTGGLRRFATYFELSSGVTRSRYITPEAVGRVVGRDPEFFKPAVE